MANELSKDDLRRFARLGAMRRLEDIRREEATIRAAFPELFAGGGGRAGKSGRAGKATASAAAAAPARARKAPGMSDAMRQAVSARMKKYWAARRKAKAAAAKNA